MGEAWTLNTRGSRVGPDQCLDGCQYEVKTQGDWTGEISKLPIKHMLTTSPPSTSTFEMSSINSVAGSSQSTIRQHDVHGRRQLSGQRAT